MAKDGVEELNDRRIKIVERILTENADKPYLRSFVNYLGENRTWATKIEYLRYVLNFSKYVNKAPEEIRLDDYINFMATIKGMSSYKIPVYHALKAYSKYLYISDRSPKNYMDNVDRPSAVEEVTTIKKREKAYLTDEEIGIVLDAVKNGTGSIEARRMQKNWRERDYAIIMLLLSTGLRQSAVLQLDIDNVDLWNSRIITFEKGRKPVEKYLTMVACDALYDWIKKREEILDGKEEKALFISLHKTRMTVGAMNALIQKYTANIPNKKITAHKFRATYGSKLLEQTGDIYMVQKAMNHSSPKTTELYIRGQQDKVNEKQRDVMQNFLENF